MAYQSENLSKQELEELVSHGKASIQDSNGNYLNSSYDKLQENYIITVYEKGKYFLFDLMNAMGEEVFYHMLQKYYHMNAFQEASTKDFIDLVYQYSDNEEVKNLIKLNLKE